jgi:predicted transcriptional regulator
MVLSKGQQKILDILAEKSNHNPGMSVFDTAIIKESGLPGEEVNTYLGQLHSLGLIILGRKTADADYRLVNNGRWHECNFPESRSVISLFHYLSVHNDHCH